MEVVSTIEINGEEREIADAYAREQCAANAEGINNLNSNLDTLEYGEVAGGKNISDFDALISKMGYNNIFIKQSDGSYLCDVIFDLFQKGFVIDNISENKQYTFSIKIKCGTGSNFRFSIVYTDGTNTTSNSAITSDFTFTMATSEEGKIISYLRFDWSTAGTFYIKDFQVEEGTKATSYEPYIPSVKMLADEVSAQNDSLEDQKMLGWTVPSECPIQNYVDSDGVFHQRVGRVDLGSLNWTYDSSFVRFAAYIPDKIIPSSNTEWTRGLYCSIYKASGSPILGTKVDMTISGYNSDDVIFINNFSYTDATTFKNAMKGVYLYYELAEEKTINVDGNEAVVSLKNDLSNLKDGTTPVAKAVADEDGNNIKSTYAKKTEIDTKANITDPVFTGSFSQNREAGSTIGTNSHAEGKNTTASGNSSHAEGNGATAEGYTSHAEGDGYAIGDYSHAEGNMSTAEGDKSHAEGTRSWGLGSNSHAEGYQTTASGSSSHSEGSSTNRVSDITTDFSKETSISDIITLRKSNKFSLAHGYGSHVEGINSLALGRSSHAEGENTIASDTCSHAEGINTTASGNISHAEGSFTEASGMQSHAEGGGTVASGIQSHAEGKSTTASGDHSHAEGEYTTASGENQHAQGKYNVEDTTSAFIIGNGTSISARSNAFSVKFTGVVRAASTITASTTADYAEFFEWLDENPNNEDRVGYFVTLDGNRIKIASDNDDYILGIVSGEPFVLGNGDCDTWNGMYLHDEFRRTIYEPAPKVEEVEIKEEQEETYIDEETGEEKTRTVEVVIGHEFKEVEGEFDGTRPKLNPEYDNTQQYVSRFDRKEWSPVGMLGVLAVRHDGTAKVNGYVTVNKDGIATACDKNIENSYRVIKANTDSVVEIVFR